MQCKILGVLLDCCDSDLENNFENNACNLEHDADKTQEILNRIMREYEHNNLSPNHKRICSDNYISHKIHYLAS